MAASRHVARWLLVSALGISSGAAAQNGEPPPKTVDARELEPLAEDACLVVRDIRSFDALDDSHVFVAGRRGQAYLLTMLPACIGLRSALGVAFESRLARVCSTSAASLRYRGFGNREETCPIRQVEAVEDKSSAERLVELRAN